MKTWASKYDEEVSLFNYNGPELMAREFAKLNVPKDVKVIDIAAGTGALGKELKALGYTCIDALDGSEGMLEAARKKNIYRNLFQFLLGCDKKSPITYGTYDIAVSCGGIGIGHIPYSAFHDILTMVKQGGLVCWATINPKEEQEKETYNSVITELKDSGKWEAVQDPVRVEEFYKNELALFYVMKKL
ncbi:methyltransferase-like protein 27 isoform X3 [Limulus polyphemus]|uniref:Methyltransferase-like protein 27 isoform X3 n=1 Tax=Limulus polyphemus TaxID=6850 RepID=A0ABM1T251_LIMPO|nr:methyltransferase-like protein 27 isoform X3 [Limulus polyphemus]